MVAGIDGARSDGGLCFSFASRTGRWHWLRCGCSSKWGRGVAGSRAQGEAQGCLGVGSSGCRAMQGKAQAEEATAASSPRRAPGCDAGFTGVGGALRAEGEASSRGIVHPRALAFYRASEGERSGQQRTRRWHSVSAAYYARDDGCLPLAVGRGGDGGVTTGYSRH